MINYKEQNITKTIKLWYVNNNYPINNYQKFIDSFIDALTKIYEIPEIKNKNATQTEYNNYYNKIMLNPIFDSHPIEFVWRSHPDEFLEDVGLATDLAKNTFETIETKNAYLISLAVAFKKSAPNSLDETTLDKASELIYNTIFDIENSEYNNSLNNKNISDNYRYLDDGQALAFQIQYHRWMLLNKSILPETSYMRNRFINIVIRKNFSKHTPNPENKTETSFSESHKKLKTEISQHLLVDNSDFSNDVFNKWIHSFTNNVMLVYYGFYKWDKLRGDFYEVIDLEKSQFGNKLPDQYERNQIEFSKFIDISK